MKLKQTNIMNLINKINERMQANNNEVVYFTFNEVLSILKISDLQIKYNGGMETLANELSSQKQFEWHRIGCLSFCLEPIKEFCFIAYGRKIGNEYDTTGTIKEYKSYECEDESEFDDDDFWIDLGFSEDELI